MLRVWFSLLLFWINIAHLISFLNEYCCACDILPWLNCIYLVFYCIGSLARLCWSIDPLELIWILRSNGKLSKFLWEKSKYAKLVNFPSFHVRLHFNYWILILVKVGFWQLKLMLNSKIKYAWNWNEGHNHCENCKEKGWLRQFFNFLIFWHCKNNSLFLTKYNLF